MKIFRKMVCDCLTGVQTTLSTYGVQHDQFDFESELGWEGSNNKVLEIMKNSDYYVPQTQCNDKGVPQGAYLDMDGFIRDQGLKGQGWLPEGLPTAVCAQARRIHPVHLPRHRVLVQEGVAVGSDPQHHLLRAGFGAAEGEPGHDDDEPGDEGQAVPPLVRPRQAHHGQERSQGAGTSSRTTSTTTSRR